MAQPMKVRKGDVVQILSGKDRGKQGRIIEADPKKRRVIVENLNVVKKHQRATRATTQGGPIDKDIPIPVANVAR